MKDLIIRSILFAEISFALAFFGLAVLPRSTAFQSLERDYSNNEKYCKAEALGKHLNSKDCQTFIYKVLDDPTAFLTGLLFLATIMLFLVTIALYIAAVSNSRDAERLFAQDQRAWIQADWNAADFAVIGSDDITISFDLTVKNLGKSPAYEVTKSWIFLHHDLSNLRQYFDRTRHTIPERMAFHGETVLPGQEVVCNNLILRVSAAEIEASRGTRSIGTGYIALAMMFRSKLTGSVHEVSRLFQLNIKDGCPLYLVHELCKESEASVTLISMPAFNITT